MNYQKLFNYLKEQHGITLLQHDMQEIINIVNEMQQTDVNDCFSSHEYNLLRNNKGKQKAFVNGWKSAENGQPTIKCPYNPKAKDFIPTNPYYKAWHSGYESFLNNRYSTLNA